MTQDLESPFLKIPCSEHIAANDLAFAIYDRFPVSNGHALGITRRMIATWCEASDSEQAATISLVNEVQLISETVFKLCKSAKDSFEISGKGFLVRSHQVRSYL
jgi:diadenosine tetraphosphate (Ap4A) HIT family hydrolase